MKMIKSAGFFKFRILYIYPEIRIKIWSKESKTQMGFFKTKYGRIILKHSLFNH